MSAEAERPELIYVADPMCSWCWGFAPSIRRLRLDSPNAFRYSLVVGGLRTGNSALELTDHVVDYLKNAWRDVERRSGQPFSHDYLDRRGFVYDTEPACRAVVAARMLKPDVVFDYNEALQDAFYRRSLDPTSPESFRRVARETGLPEDRFEEHFMSDDVARAARLDFELARRLGVNGFPSVLIRSRENVTPVARGWLPPEAFEDQVRAWRTR